MKHSIINFFLLIGVIDYIENGIITAEITTSTGEIIYRDIPEEILPCKAIEGGMFYFSYGGVRFGNCFTRLVCWVSYRVYILFSVHIS